MKNKTTAGIFALLLLLSSGATYAQCNLISQGTQEKKMYVTDFDKPIQVIKKMSPKDTTYLLQLVTYQDILIDNLKGAKVYLANKSRSIINKEVEIDVEKSDKENYKYKYLALFTITDIDIVYMSIYDIIGFELYIFDGEIKESEMIHFKNQLNCIFSQKN